MGKHTNHYVPALEGLLYRPGQHDGLLLTTGRREREREREREGEGEGEGEGGRERAIY